MGSPPANRTRLPPSALNSRMILAAAARESLGSALCSPGFRNQKGDWNSHAPMMCRFSVGGTTLPDGCAPCSMPRVTGAPRWTAGRTRPVQREVSQTLFRLLVEFRTLARARATWEAFAAAHSGQGSHEGSNTAKTVVLLVNLVERRLADLLLTGSTGVFDVRLDTHRVQVGLPEPPERGEDQPPRRGSLRDS